MRRRIFVLGLGLALASPVRAGSTGVNALLTASGSRAGTSAGDYVSDRNGLDTAYHFWIEVPAGAPRLVVQVFDPDIGLGGSGEASAGRDRARNVSFATSASYTLFDPSGAAVTTAFAAGSATAPAGSDNSWLTLYDSGTTPAPPAGHWELRVDTSSAVTTGSDVNAFGLRAHDGTPGVGGTEMNVYTDGILPIGVNPPASGTTLRGYYLYPWITSGCSCAKNDFDYDSNQGNVGSMAFTGPTGSFTQAFGSSSLSADNAWRRDTIAGFTSDAWDREYGIWQADVRIVSYTNAGGQNGNYATLWMSDFQAAANPPAANPPANAFRIYFPSDAGTAPYKPHVSQQVTWVSGPNPPVPGQSSIYLVTVTVTNPTPKNITFSGSHVVTARVPGSGVVYGGSLLLAQGNVTSQPAVGGTGDVIWNPHTLSPGSDAWVSYRVKVTPAAAGERVVVTGTPASGDGTRAQYVDETGNTSQARATYTFGPLCELAVTAGAATPVSITEFSAE